MYVPFDSTLERENSSIVRTKVGQRAHRSIVPYPVHQF